MGIVKLSAPIALTLAAGGLLSCGHTNGFGPGCEEVETRILYGSARNLSGAVDGEVKQLMNIWSMRSDGSDSMPLTRAVKDGVINIGGVPTPDGEKIVYYSNRNLDLSDDGATNVVTNIFIMNWDGTGTEARTSLQVFGTGSLYPLVTRDGQRIVYVSKRNLDGSADSPANGAANLWVMDIDGKNNHWLTKVTTSGVDLSYPQLSPDGTRIVFVSDRNLDKTNTGAIGVKNIWMMNLDGSGLTSLTNTTATGAVSITPVFSPDGKTVVYSSKRNLDKQAGSVANAAYNLWSINIDGSDDRYLTNVTTSGATADFPKYSPDGTLVSFHSMRNLDMQPASPLNATMNVWLVATDGTQLRPLTSHTDSNLVSGFAQFLPDGSGIFFSSSMGLVAPYTDSSYVMNLWTINSDGTGKTPLTFMRTATSDGQAVYPAYQRCARTGTL